MKSHEINKLIRHASTIFKNSSISALTNYFSNESNESIPYSNELDSSNKSNRIWLQRCYNYTQYFLNIFHTDSLSRSCEIVK